MRVVQAAPDESAWGWLVGSSDLAWLGWGQRDNQGEEGEGGKGAARRKHLQLHPQPQPQVQMQILVQHRGSRRVNGVV